MKKRSGVENVLNVKCKCKQLYKDISVLTFKIIKGCLNETRVSRLSVKKRVLRM